jgi:hypothetical protein
MFESGYLTVDQIPQARSLEAAGFADYRNATSNIQYPKSNIQYPMLGHGEFRQENCLEMLA